MATQAIQNSKGCGTTAPQSSHIKPFDAIADKFRVGKHSENISAIQGKLKDSIHKHSFLF
ncbi:hypothetical protein PGT21_005784 [Puccinia graminis f. sp. tritici]|uniref:Uncharacterized protein n=1 Tax=Puccinia graminis f. sp. tritici TaxID=56615 RepID=A0A5B0LNW3_PUCGR|nr:hypothetical protein PGT21_005784 [Puccinia graminis f. sp. tritici]KAA1080051.1 hypothetical protein PGTUg99_025118 [Puccinia graminis f. sp. tritici]